MYQSFYGLSDLPFELTRNSRFVFQSARHREALNQLEDGLSSGRPLTVLLGKAGTGKTTILHAALQSERCHQIRSICLATPMVARGELFPSLLAELEADARTGSTAATPLQTIEALLFERRSRGVITVLAVDEAESLSDDRLEEVCALMAVQSNGVQLLPLVLAGQDVLGSRLDLLRLKERGVLRCELAPLDLSETASYILWRTRTAGAPGGSLFTREAVTLIHELSEGIPRTINVICDNALFIGFSHKVKPVTRDTVTQVSRRLDVGSLRDPAAAVPVRTPLRRSPAGALASSPDW